MKKEYKKPEIEITQLEVEDIITTSSVSFNPEGWNLNSGDPWYN